MTPTTNENYDLLCSLRSINFFLQCAILSQDLKKPTAEVELYQTIATLLVEISNRLDVKSLGMYRIKRRIEELKPPALFETQELLCLYVSKVEEVISSILPSNTVSRFKTLPLPESDKQILEIINLSQNRINEILAQPQLIEGRTSAQFLLFKQHIDQLIFYLPDQPIEVAYFKQKLSYATRLPFESAKEFAAIQRLLETIRMVISDPMEPESHLQEWQTKFNFLWDNPASQQKYSALTLIRNLLKYKVPIPKLEELIEIELAESGFHQIADLVILYHFYRLKSPHLKEAIQHWVDTYPNHLWTSFILPRSQSV